MNSLSINFSTGPVNISKEVQMALVSSSIPHRSKEFSKLYNDTRDLLCEKFNTKQAFLITGTGTASNEAMIQQIKMQGGKGMVLSNGEFGTRLIEQATRASLEFMEYSLVMGEIFDIGKIENTIIQNEIRWALFCHCETSTGVVNDLSEISEVCSVNNCLCFVDCMSTVGTCSFDLSHIAMATASSGKGLGSVSGLGIIFSNIEVISSPHIPLYLDLRYYSNKAGIPFTISSILVDALYVSINQKLQDEYFKLINHYSNGCFQLLSENNMLPYCNEKSKVFTLAIDGRVPDFVDKLKRKNIIISYESEYLKRMNLCQIAFFGYYQKNDLEKLLVVLKEAIAVFAE